MPDSLEAAVASRVRQFREEQGWTQAGLADRLGWVAASVWMLENGRRHVKVADLEALAAVFDVPPEELLVGPAVGTVSVPTEALDRLVKVAMWVSRGRSMAHTPDPILGPVYPDATARAALGLLDEAGLLDSYRQAEEPS
ncbi:helix-turn-helix domain-containing protein [Streptomyces zhihengii]